MDYKYIEQLLERYWDCETTREEESILRTFFSQKDVPVRLVKYRGLFEYQKQSVEENTLGDDFDRKVLDAIGEDTEAGANVVKAKVVSMTAYLKPLFKAAAIVAMVLTIGDAAQWSMGNSPHNEAAQPMMAADTARIDNGMVTADVGQTAIDSIAAKSLRTVKDSIMPGTSVEQNIR